MQMPLLDRLAKGDECGLPGDCKAPASAGHHPLAAQEDAALADNVQAARVAESALARLPLLMDTKGWASMRSEEAGMGG